jgi:mannobiose 2-epimerase
MVNALHLMDARFGRETPKYGDAFSKAWALARDAFADHEHPGVCPRMDERGGVSCDSKSHQWFVSYHTARALLSTADRLKKP